MGKGFGLGKTVLVGDAFVQFGIPAIVAAIEQVTAAEVRQQPGSGWTLEDLRPEIEGYKSSKLKQQGESVDRVLQAMGIDLDKTRIKITLGGDLLAGSGIGASAAGCVALARALNEEFNLSMTDDSLNRVAFEGEKAYHGDPGGVDNAASTFGGILWFQKNLSSQKDLIERIVPAAVLHVLLANSGVNVDTSRVISYKKERMNNHPEQFKAALQASGEQAVQLRRSLERNDLDRAGRIMDEHHQILRGLRFSHERIEAILKIARREGALGGKITGGGMGGYALILTMDELHQGRVAEAIEDKGFRTLKSRVLP
ncbi:MAG: mevalonate kinase [Thermodesulfobacteriota bacterium]